MPKEDQKTTFIVTTSSAHGAWYPEKKSTLSLINSHVANRKAQLASQRRNQSAKPTRQARPRKRNSLASTNPADEEQDEPVASSSAASVSKAAWSLDELEDIFGKQDQQEAEPRVQPTTHSNVAVSNPFTNHTIQASTKSNQAPSQTPLQARYQHGYQQQNDRPGPAKWNPAATGPRDLVLRLPHRGEPQGTGYRRPHNVDLGEPIRQPSHHYNPPTIPKPIESILDPFLRLAISVSSYEQHLLHFYFTEGRQVLYGTSAQPAFCPALHVANRGLLQRSPAYVETHVAMAEHLLCGLRSEQVTANFFRRRADAYKTVGDLVLSPDADFDSQLCGLIYLQMAEHTIGRTDLQSVHLKAMNQLVDRRGGIRFFLESKDPGSALTEPIDYASQYAFARFETEGNNEVLTRAKEDVINNLRRIRLWTLRAQGLDAESASSTQLSPRDRRTHQATLSKLSAYLTAITNMYLRIEDAPHHQSAGAFNLLFSLCTTLSTYNLGLPSTLRFVSSLQSIMERSTDASRTQTTIQDNEVYSELVNLHPCAVVGMLAHLRRGLEPELRDAPVGIAKTEDGHLEGFSREVTLAGFSINAMLIFPLLDFGARLRLSRALFRSAMCLCDLTVCETFEESELQDLNVVISKAYLQSQPLELKTGYAQGAG